MGKEYRSFAVYIEKTEAGIHSGWFMNLYIQEYVMFRDLGEMIVKMDESLHWLIEQEEQRGLDEMTCYHSFRDFTFQSKPQSFYLIQILYTEHHSWQGLLTGTNQPRTAFRSTLDCILLMNHAMQGKRVQRKQA